MLALAINLLFATAALAAALTLIDTALKARRTYDRLLREKALMDAGFMMQIEPREVRLRPAPRREAAMRARRSPLMQPALARGAV